MSKLWNYLDRRALGTSDALAAAGAVVLGTLLVFWLGGCAQTGQFAAADAQNAARIAAAIDDSAGAACWPILATTGNAVAAAGNAVGLLTGIEEKRAVRLALQDPACQPVWAGVLAEVLKATPAAPFVP